MFLAQIERYLTSLGPVSPRLPRAQTLPLPLPPPALSAPVAALDETMGPALPAPLEPPELDVVVVAARPKRKRPPRSALPRPPKPPLAVAYAHPLLRRYDAFYQRVREQMTESPADIKKVTAPVPTSVYDEMMVYLTKHKDEAGYPQSIREFVTLAIRNLTVDLAGDAVEGEPHQACVGTVA